MARKVAKPKEALKPGTKKYVCIRRCFDFGRVWKPRKESTKEKDYLLVTDKPVSEKNFMEVDKAPELPSAEPEKGKALSEHKADEFLD